MAERTKKYSPEDSANDSTLSMESIGAVNNRSKTTDDGPDMDCSEDVSDSCYTNGVHDMSDLPESPISNYESSNGLGRDECSLDESGIGENDHSRNEEQSNDNQSDTDESTCSDNTEVDEDGQGSEEFEGEEGNIQESGSENVDDVGKCSSDVEGELADTDGHGEDTNAREDVDTKGNEVDVNGRVEVDTVEHGVDGDAQNGVDTNGHDDIDIDEHVKVDTDTNDRVDRDEHVNIDKYEHDADTDGHIEVDIGEHGEVDTDTRDDVDTEGHDIKKSYGNSPMNSEALNTPLPSADERISDIAKATVAIDSITIADSNAIVEHRNNGPDADGDDTDFENLIQSTEKQLLTENNSDEEQANNTAEDDESRNKNIGSDGGTASKDSEDKVHGSGIESVQELRVDTSHDDANSSKVDAETLKGQSSGDGSSLVDKGVANMSVEQKSAEISTSSSLQVYLEPVPPGQPLDLLLIGLTGHGKTSMCKTILGKPDTSAERTTECFLIETLVDGRQLRLLDTPGTIDNKNSELALKDVANIFALNPNGFHAILFVMKYGCKMSRDELGLSEMLKVLLGDDVFNDYAILIVTHGDKFKQDALKGVVSGDVKAYIDQQDCGLKELLVECKQRVMLFDSAEQDPGKRRKQICHLVSMVDEIVNSNGGKRYDNSYFKLARKEMELHKSTTITGTETPEKRRALEESITEQVGHAIARQIKKDNSWCFPADAVACLSSGELVRMADLKVGDKVLSYASDNRLVFSEVYMLGHADNDVILPCVKIRTSKSCIRLSPGHYMFISKESDSGLTPIAAENVTCGDRMFICRLSSDLTIQQKYVELETVTEIQSTFCRGMYAPFTQTGTIVVDGVLASCYVNLLPPGLSHRLLWPVRKLYAVCPGLCSILSYGRFDGIPLWMHWCVKSLLPVLPLRYFRQ